MSALDNARAVLGRGAYYGGSEGSLYRVLAALVVECDRLREALERIDRWAGRLDEDDADVVWEIVHRALNPDDADWSA